MDSINQDVQQPTEAVAKKARALSVKQWMSLIHGWIGGISAAFILCVSVTGIGLAFFGEMAELQYGEMLYAPEPESHALPSALFASAEAGHPGFQSRGLMMPDTRMENIQTALVWGMAEDAHGEQGVFLVSLDPGTAEFKGSFDLHDMFAHEFNDFHFTLLAGDVGQFIMAVLAILLCVFALSGIYLWWPRKGGALGKVLTLQRNGRWHSLWFNWHGLAGIWCGLIIVFYSLTGLGISQSGWFGPLLSRISDPIEWEERFRHEDCGDTVTMDDALRQAQAAFPNRELTQLNLVTGDQFKYVITMRGPGDMDARFGDAEAQVHMKCKNAMWTTTLSDEDVPTVIGNQLLSLHGAHFLPGHWPAIITALTGILLTLLAGSGLYLFVKRTLPSTKTLLKRHV